MHFYNNNIKYTTIQVIQMNGIDECEKKPQKLKINACKPTTYIHYLCSKYIKYSWYGSKFLKIRVLLGQ